MEITIFLASKDFKSWMCLPPESDMNVGRGFTLEDIISDDWSSFELYPGSGGYWEIKLTYKV